MTGSGAFFHALLTLRSFSKYIERILVLSLTSNREEAVYQERHLPEMGIEMICWNGWMATFTLRESVGNKLRMFDHQESRRSSGCIARSENSSRESKAGNSTDLTLMMSALRKCRPSKNSMKTLWHLLNKWHEGMKRSLLTSSIRYWQKHPKSLCIYFRSRMLHKESQTLFHFFPRGRLHPQNQSHELRSSRALNSSRISVRIRSWLRCHWRDLSLPP